MAETKSRKRTRVIALAGAAVFLLAGWGTAYLIRYSATSEAVCNMCHPELTPRWKSSNGHPAETTSCHQCHSKGLRLIPADWNVLKHARDQLVPPEYLADDGLTAQRCLDCHQDVLTWAYQVKKKVITFNHRIHAQEGLDCISCHRTAGHEYMTEGSNRPSIRECLNCHRKEFLGPPENQKCLNCHDVLLIPGRKR